MNTNKQMMCEMCGKKPATVFIKKNINGKEIKKQLCADCASIADNGNWIDNFFGADFLSSIMGIPFGNTAMQRERSCPKCGRTERQIVDSFEFGCEECYKAFADLAKSYIKQLGGRPHKGRTPLSKVSNNAETDTGKQNNSQKELTVEEQISNLEKEKQLAVEQEDYDKALILKKQIDQLKNRG